MPLDKLDRHNFVTCRARKTTKPIMWRNLLITLLSLSIIVFCSCVPEYEAPDKDACIETWDKDTTMVHPSVYLDYPGNENGVIDAQDIIFSNYDVQLIDASTDEMMEEGHVPNYLGHAFMSVKPGMYYLRFMIPEGYRFVMMDSNSAMFDSDLDSDVVSELGYTDIFEIQCHEQITDLKAIIQKL